MRGRNVNINNLKYHLTNFSSIYLTQAFFNGCFYGIRSLFVLYIISQFSFTETQAINLFATFMILCYGTSLAGGYIADKALGVKNTIMMGGALSALGLLCVLFSSQDLCFFGLALASLGSGFLKPNISTAIGLLFKNPKDPKKDRAYSFLYIAMNLGSFIASIVCGFVGKTYGWYYGVLLISGVFSGATYFVYKTMKFHPSYKEKPIVFKGRLFGGISFLIFFLYLLFKYQESLHGLMGIIACGSIIYFGVIFYQCQGKERKDVLVICLYIFLFALFCTLFEQAGTSLMLFYEKAVDRHLMGTVIPSSTLLSLDPLFVLLCGPLLIFLSNQYLEKTKPLTGLTKTGVGFLFVTFSFWILAFSTFQNEASFIPLLWVIGAMLIQTIGELWIAPVSFSKISQYAPARYKSVMMSFWPMAIAYGHYFAGFIAQFSLNDSTTLSSGNSFEQYRSFFMYLSLLPLCVGSSLLLYQGSKIAIILARKRKTLSKIFCFFTFFK